MASGGNTWCKKLMNKQKAYAVKRALGTAPRKGAACTPLGNPRKCDIAPPVEADKWAYLQGTHWNDTVVPMSNRQRKRLSRMGRV